MYCLSRYCYRGRKTNIFPNNDTFRVDSIKVATNKTHCRRDKEFCHECRFCCTLSMCTTKYGTIFNKPASRYKEEKNKNWMHDAMGAFGNDQRLYKRNDYRCLKPSNKTPEDWDYFDMKGFRSATTQEQLNNVKGNMLPKSHILIIKF